jgi:hypothetical protein
LRFFTPFSERSLPSAVDPVAQGSQVTTSLPAVN